MLVAAGQKPAMLIRHRVRDITDTTRGKRRFIGRGEVPSDVERVRALVRTTQGAIPLPPLHLPKLVSIKRCN